MIIYNNDIVCCLSLIPSIPELEKFDGKIGIVRILNGYTIVDFGDDCLDISEESFAFHIL